MEPHEDPAPSFSVRLHAVLQSCSHSFDSGDFCSSNDAIAAVICLLDSIAESTPPVPDAASEEALSLVLGYISSPSFNQMAVDALSMELPKVVVKFAGLSVRCREISGAIIDRLVLVCSPRDMLSIICEALAIHVRVSKAPDGHILLLRGLSKVLFGIQRHHVVQVKAAVPVILNVIYVVSSECDEDDIDPLCELFGEAIALGKSIQGIYKKLVDTRKGELCAILGLYTLQNIALISRSCLSRNISNVSSLIKQVSEFLPFCGLSYIGLITGCAVDAIKSQISQKDRDDFMAYFSLSMNGASLAVVWGHICKEVANAAGEDLVALLNNLQNDRTKRWQAIGMLGRILSSIDYPWEIKFPSVELLLNMVDGCKPDSNDIEFSSFMPSIFASLQAIQQIIIGASHASSRKKAFSALKMVLSEVPASQRVDMLKALIVNSNSPSMIAILIDIVKMEMAMKSPKCSPRNQDKNQQNATNHLPFWSSVALDFVEMVLRPPRGGPPTLPEDSEPVLSALNTYRYILIAEYSGNTNYTGVLSENCLHKAYEEWLLPLRTLVSGILAESAKDDSEVADGIICALNPVQLVLHHCIELIEECKKPSSKR